MDATERGFVDVVTNVLNSVKHELPSAQSILTGVTNAANAVTNLAMAGLERYRQEEKAKLDAMTPEQREQYKEDKRKKIQEKKQAKMNKLIEKVVAQRVAEVTKRQQELERQAAADKAAMEKAMALVTNAAAKVTETTAASRSIAPPKTRSPKSSATKRVSDTPLQPVKKLKTLATRQTIVPQPYVEPLPPQALTQRQTTVPHHRHHRQHTEHVRNLVAESAVVPDEDESSQSESDEWMRQESEIFLGDDGYMHQATHYPDVRYTQPSRHYHHHRHSRHH